MKKDILIFIFLLISIHMMSSNSYTQYYKLMTEAMTFEATENYQDALKTYQKAFETTYPFTDDVLLAIECCKKAGFSNEIPSLIQKLILCGYKRELENIPAVVFEEGNYYKWIRERDFEYSEFEACFNSVYDSCRAVYLNRIDKESDRYLSAFNQFEFFTISMRKRSSGIEDIKLLQKIAWGTSCQLLLDLYNSGLVDICRQSTDTWNDDRFLTCLIHIGQECKELNREEEYFSFLQQMVLAGNLHPRQYAQIRDAAVYFMEYGKSCYGESLSFDSETMRVKITELDNPSEVDKIRAELFLPPLWVIAKVKNYILPTNYKH